MASSAQGPVRNFCDPLFDAEPAFFRTPLNVFDVDSNPIDDDDYLRVSCFYQMQSL